MDMLAMSARALSSSIRQGALTVREAVQTYLDQIEEKDGEVHAYVTVAGESLENRIKEVEDGIKSGRYSGPLAGVPIAVKDNICTKGMATTCSSKMLENYIPAYEAEAVRRLEEAGMVVVGKTNMDEFAMGSTTETSAFGITRNPWNTEHVPGGSSGGSCAAVAAGEAPLALGSDTGGSIRQPASYCGVVGLKPSYGRVSRYGLIAYASSLDQIGPIGKNVGDVAALYEILAGHDTKDSTSLDLPVETAEELVSGGLAGKKIGIPEEYLTDGTDSQVKKVMQDTIETLRAQGAVVETFPLGMVDYVIPAYYIIACAEASSNLERFDGVKYGYRTKDASELHEMFKKSRAEGFGEEVKRRILLGSFVLSAGYYDAYYLKALRAKGLIKEAFDKAFASYDCILAPASPTAAPKIGTSLLDPLQMYLSDIFTVAVNLAGLPAVTVPCGKTEEGLPVGLQFIGDRLQEKKILSAAAGFEEARGPFGYAFEGRE